MFLSRAMSMVESLEVAYPSSESTYAAPTPTLMTLDRGRSQTKRRRPLPPIPVGPSRPRQRPSLARMPTFMSGRHSSIAGMAKSGVPTDEEEEEEDCEVIDISEMLSSEPSSSGSSDGGRSLSDQFPAPIDTRRGPVMSISSHSRFVSTPGPITADTNDYHDLDKESAHSPLEVFSPRLPPAPLLLGLPESRPITPYALPPLELGAASGMGILAYPPVGTSFLFMSASGSGDQSISDFGSFIGPPSGSMALSIGRSSSSTMSRFLNIDERDLEAENHISMSGILSRSMPRTSEVSAGLPSLHPFDLSGLVGLRRPDEQDIPGKPIARLIPKPGFKLDTAAVKQKWNDPFDHGFVQIDGLPEITLPEPLCAIDHAEPEPLAHRLLPRASIATETMHSPEVGAWWKTCVDQPEYGRRRSVMDVQSVLQRDCEV